MIITKVLDTHYKVENGKGTTYNIRKAVYGDHWVCECKAFIYRRVDKDCKHIVALYEFIKG